MKLDKRITYGIYDDDDTMMDALKQFRKDDVKIKEVFTPFPVHGLDDVLGLKQSRLGYVAFILGVIGLGLGLLMMWYMNVYDWPINIGGKPNFSLAENVSSFVPVAFETTVFVAAHGMVIIFLARCNLFPGKSPENPIPRSTADQFVVQFDEDNDLTKEELHEMIRKSKAIEIKELD